MTLREDMVELLSHPLDGTFDTQADAILALVRERLLSDTAVEAAHDGRLRYLEQLDCRASVPGMLRAALTAALDAMNSE